MQLLQRGVLFGFDATSGIMVQADEKPYVSKVNPRLVSMYIPLKLQKNFFRKARMKVKAQQKQRHHMNGAIACFVLGLKGKVQSLLFTSRFEMLSDKGETSCLRIA